MHFSSDMGRAHNWDKSRKVAREKKNGEAQYILEEYDDLEGDKPSCFSGVKRRLFQSVLGHSLLTILTIDLLEEELKLWVVDLFRKKLKEATPDDVKIIEKINNDLMQIGINLTRDQEQKMALLNITDEEKNELCEALTAKYAEQFDQEMKGYLLSRLLLTATGSYSLHAISLGLQLNAALQRQSHRGDNPEGDQTMSDMPNTHEGGQVGHNSIFSRRERPEDVSFSNNNILDLS